VLIGLWERSTASRQMKQMMGNPDAVASAYSLKDYEIAGDLAAGLRSTICADAPGTAAFAFQQIWCPIIWALIPVGLWNTLIGSFRCPTRPILAIRLTAQTCQQMGALVSSLKTTITNKPTRLLSSSALTVGQAIPVTFTWQ